ncbi:MAG: DUF72 domain-containing protein [candidate division WOR-3 bacterium]
MIKIGCCGFPCAMKTYYQLFRVVELQNTFYTMPKLVLLEKWRKAAPAEFEFIIKAPQFITHPATSPTYRRANIELKNPDHYGSFKPTKEVRKIWDTVLTEAEILKTKVILFQTPASFQPNANNIKNLKNFFQCSERKNLIFAWEPRGDWEPELIKQLCQELNLIDCVDPFVREPTAGKILYFRLHGGKGYRQKYSPKDLKWLATLIKKKNGYILFNNIHMLEDAKRLQAMTK